MKREWAFGLVAFAFAVNMLGATLPTPLYPVYERTYGFSTLAVTLIFATYAFGVVAALMLFGHLSDEIGRKPVLVAGTLLSLGSALLFLFAHDAAPIFAGRVLSGFSAGIFTGSCTAALVDLANPQRRVFATTVAVAVNIGGLGCGTLMSGLLAQYAPYPQRTVFAIDAVLATLALIALAFVPETVVRQRGAGLLRLQRLRVPREIRATFVQAAVAGSCGFASAGLFSSIAPSILARELHLPNHALAGLLVTMMMFSSAAGQLLVGSLAERSALVAGTLAVLLGIALLATALTLSNALSLFASAVATGFGQGLVIGAGLAQINARIEQRRGEVSSAYFFVLYLAVAVPVVGVGLIATRFGITTAGLTFCAIAMLSLVVVLASENLRRLTASLREG
jgi:MFS family permease